MNNNLISKKYNNIIIKTIALKNIYPIACSSCISLEKGFDGILINDLTNLKINLKYTFLTIFPQDEQKNLITNLLLKHVENFAISPSLWDSMTKENKDFICKVFSSNIYFWERDLKEIEELNLFI